jgi:O-antigen ligase
VTQDAVHLWLGAGLNANDNFYLHGFFIPHYHSLYWNQLYYGGVVGLILYLAMLGTVLYHGFHRSALSPWWYLLVGMSVALMVDGDHFFMAPSPLFICFLLPFFMTLFGRDDTRETLDHA